MSSYGYPNIYPSIKPEDARELNERKVLVIDRHVAQEVLSPEAVLSALEEAYKEEGLGSAVNRTKANILVPTPDHDVWYRYCTMEGGIQGMGVVAIRIKSDIVRDYSAFGSARQDWHCGFPGRFFGLILLFSASDGTLLAFLHDAHIQHMRVAGTVTLATRHLARPDSTVLGILGSGGMAWTYALLIPQVRSIREIKVYSPNPEHRRRFGEQVEKALQIKTTVMESAEPVVRGSDIVTACTNAQGAVIMGGWLEPGMHIILTRLHTELDHAGWRKVNRLVVYRSPLGVQGTSSETRWTASPDWRFAGGMTPDKMALERNSVGEDKIFPLSDVLLGKAPGRQGNDEITATYNEGTGVQFAAVALKVYEQAKARGLGKSIPLDWFLQDVTN